MMKTRHIGTLCSGKDAGGMLRRGVVLLAALLLVCTLMAGAVSADDVTVTTWEQLSGNFSDGKIIHLGGDIDLKDNLTLTSGNVTLDLGNYRLSNTARSDAYPIEIDGGNLTIKGSGSIEYSNRLIQLSRGTLDIQSGTLIVNGNEMVVRITGSDVPTAKEYSNLIVGENAVLKGGRYVAFITADSNKFYGITMDIAGKLLSCENPATGGALYVNGQLKVPDVLSNPSEITIRSTAEIAPSKGNAVYAAGYAKWIIEGGTFTGTEALSIKSGEWIIEGGTFTGNGEFADPAVSWSNGSEDTGAAVSVTTNHDYAKNVNITITGGEFISAKQSAFYEGPGTKHKGTALKKVAISGGTFTTQNDTLSAVTIHSSGNNTITGGISIKDTPDGNNLLYRGVNLTSSDKKYNAKWGGDASGYTLEITGAGNYKLMDSLALKSMTVSTDNTIIDGNKNAGVKVTLVESAGKNPIKISGKSVILKNLDLTAAGYSSADANGVVQFTGTSGKFQDSKIDFSGITLSSGSFAAVRLNGADGEVSGSEIINGNSEKSSSQCIVVAGDNAVIENNKLTTGKALSTLKDAVHTSSGSVAVRVTGAVTKIFVKNNSITSTWSGSDTTRNSGVGLDTFTSSSIEAIITGNTITLNDANRTDQNNKALGGYGSVLYINLKGDSASIDATITGNIVKKGTYLIYADGNDGAKSITVTGTVSDNNFGTITGKRAENSTDVTIFKISDITWTKNIEPAVPEVPSVTPTTKQDGTQEVKPTENTDTSFDQTTNTAKIGGDTAVVHVEISGDGVTRDDTNGTITVPATAEIKAVYKESPADSPSTVGTTEYQINITLNEVNTTYLPTISPAYDETKASQIAGMGYTVAAMITATNDADTLKTINSKIKKGGVAVTFKVPKTWADAFGLDRIRGFHIKAGDLVGGPLPVVRGPDDGDFYTFIVKTDGFSTIVLAASTQSQPQPQPQPQSLSSGDGNMNNAFRVLFDTNGGSFISPVTYLSYGDTISQPPAPTKDGYIFGGWYTDEACTQAWSFSDSISGDMTLYAKWTSTAVGQSASSPQTASGSPAAAAPQATQASAPQTTQSQSSGAAAAPAATTAAGASPTLTQAPAPIAGLLFGLLAAGILLRRRD